jgi:molecular chaperone DnaJ
MTGCQVNVKMLDGATLNVKIPPGTNPGAKFNLRGKGMPNPRNGRKGNAIVIIKAIVPRIDKGELLDEVNKLKSKIHLDF